MITTLADEILTHKRESFYKPLFLGTVVAFILFTGTYLYLLNNLASQLNLERNNALEKGIWVYIRDTEILNQLKIDNKVMLILKTDKKAKL